MNYDDDKLIKEIRSAFLLDGMMFPVTPEEVEIMECLLDESGYPEIPEHLQSKKVSSSLVSNVKRKVFPMSRIREEKDEGSEFARAARGGKEGEGIPPEIILKMKKDKKNYEPPKE